ncbi:T9SS C-terminal target domain-containing protein [Bacteroidetes/Chlorobi group bacterium Naka2016]|jgi:subtilisin family serine protease|nr:MAG: T9SS C-terminal target domain-containing protein [Bacteroidetes/Chlorobi group bacterium Naka2016]
MKRLITIFVLFISFSLLANDYQSKLDAYSKNLFRKITSGKTNESTLTAKSYGYPFEIQNNEIYVVCLVELNSENAYLNNDYQVITKAGNVWTLKVPLNRISELEKNKQISRISFGRGYRLLLDSVRSSVRADLVHQGINLPRPYTGKGVLIGIFDTGIDLLHPDFSNENGTRVLYLWDMSETISPNPPSGFDWGKEYTKQEIDQNIQNVLQKDYDGHGTHVAGISAGNGKGKSEYKGIAPEAELIVVNGIRSGSTNSFTDADILAACNYIFNKADELGKPCVINLSIGNILGSHDNEDLLGKALSNLVSQKKGRAIVASAGNEGDLPIHSGGEVKKGNRYELLLYPYNLCEYQPELCPDIPGYFLFGADIWTDFDIIDSVYVGIYNPMSLSLIDEKGFSSKDVVDNAQIFDSTNNLVGLVSISNSSFGNSENLVIFISNEGQTDLPISEYLWTIVFVAKGNGKFDSWAALPVGSQYPGQTRFPRFQSDNSMTINSPAVGEKIISVGAYVSKNVFTNILGELNDWSSYYPIGELASFSSRGPTRDGRIAPIIAAPGMVVFSSLSSSTIPEELDSTLVEPSGIYVGAAGTSMSAPVVTGAVALLFEQNPKLSADEIIQLLKLSARKDEHTGSEPNNDFGWGKLDLLRLLQIVTEVNEEVETQGISIYPNPTHDIIFVSSKEKIENVEVFDILGNSLLKTNNIIIPVDNFPNGLYFLSIKTQSRELRTKFIKN